MTIARFRPFLGRTLDAARLSSKALAAHGARARWLPPELQPFDEIEVAFAREGGEDLSLTIAVEDGKVARMLFGAVPAGDDEADPRALTPEELAAAIDEKGAAVESLLAQATR